MHESRRQARLASPDEAFAEVVERLDEERRRLEAIPRHAWLARWKQSRKVLEASEYLLWSETRTMGRSRFIWRHGVFGYGLVMFVIMEVLLPVSKGRFPESLDELLVHMIVGVPVWLVGGFLFGAWMWRASEKRFLQNVRFQSPVPD